MHTAVQWRSMLWSTSRDFPHISGVLRQDAKIAKHLDLTHIQTCQKLSCTSYKFFKTWMVMFDIIYFEKQNVNFYCFIWHQNQTHLTTDLKNVKSTRNLWNCYFDIPSFNVCSKPVNPKSKHSWLQRYICLTFQFLPLTSQDTGLVMSRNYQINAKIDDYDKKNFTTIKQCFIWD